MGRYKYLLGTFLLSSMTFANAAVLTCTLETIKEGKKDVVSSTLSQSIQLESKGIAVGKDFYNYMVESEKVKGVHELTVIFYESNHVQDEVGGMSCTYNPKNGSKVFCAEDLTNDAGKPILKFHCRVR